MRYFAPAMLCLLSPCLFAAGDHPPFDADAVWQPPEEFLAAAHQACDNASKPGDCLAAQIARQAPPPAAAFAKAVHNDGWMREFRHAGKVGIAYVEYPFRANENRGWLLVNGSPQLVDPDDLRKLQGELKSDPAWARTVAASPKAALFPGDRTGTLGPVAVLYPDGSQEFLVDYKVTDGCRACAILGHAFFGFEFNPKGKLESTRFLGIESDLIWPLRTHTGQKFTLSLGRSPRTGCDWEEEQPPADSVLRDAARRDDQRGGARLWSYDVVGVGATQMALRCASATDSGASLVLKVIAAPGLRR